MADPRIMALSIRQPWASAIASGPKDVENRTWRTSYEPGGLIAVHASAGIEWQVPDEAWAAAGVAPYRRGMRRADWTATLPLGAVIAVATLAGCHHDRDCKAAPCSPWRVRDCWHWQLASVRVLPEPVPCRGMLGLWRLPEEAEKAVRAQLEAGHD